MTSGAHGIVERAAGVVLITESILHQTDHGR